MEHTIELLEAEIDSLESSYKKSVCPASQNYYSERILSHKKALKILKQNQIK